MNTDLEKAKKMLDASSYTCVLCKNEQIFTASQRGVRPLLDWLDGGTDLSGASAADKVVGKAAAMLYCLLGVRAVYAGVISQAALQMLQSYGIETSFGQLVPFIENRDKSSLCPMEEATRSLSDPRDAPAAIREKLRQLLHNEKTLLWKNPQEHFESPDALHRGINFS